MPDPKKNTAYTFDVPLVDAADPRVFRANPTLAAGDVTISTDEGAFGNLGSLPTVAPASGINVKAVLTSGEMNGDRIVVRFKDQTSPPEWLEVVVTITTTTQTVDDLPTAAQVNTEVVDALNVDTYAQPGQATPAATTTIRLMLAYLYKAWRNKYDATATLYQLYNDDAATVDQKASLADAAGTTTRGEIATGP